MMLRPREAPSYLPALMQSSLGSPRVARTRTRGCFIASDIVILNRRFIIPFWRCALATHDQVGETSEPLAKQRLIHPVVPTNHV